jgi:hypothetical protein
METLTTEKRLEIVAESPALPVGQMCMKLKYPFVTVAELETRFAVHVTAQAFNRHEDARIINELAGKYGIQSAEAIKRFHVNLEEGIFIDEVERERQMKRLMDDRFGFPASWERIGTTRIHAKLYKGRVAVEALDAYMGDTIPDRVLESLYVAREAGLTDFHVAYPVIDVRDVVVTQEQQKDPVLLAKLGDKFLEIDMWE